jgi:uncharacterized membrane protein YfcA
MPTETIIVFAITALLVGFSKGGLGGPVPVSLTAPLLSLVLPVSQAVGVVLPLLIFADLFALYFYWRTWDVRYTKLLLPGAIVGIVIGTLLLASLSNTVLKQVIGAFTLIAVIYKLTNDRLTSLQYVPRPWHGMLAGWATGFGSSLANVGAPPFTAYMLLQPGMSPVTFMGTGTLFFAIVNALKVPGFLSAGVLDLSLLVSILWVLPIIPFGVWFGRFVVLRMNPKLFEWIMVVGMIFMGIYLLFG